MGRPKKIEGVEIVESANYEESKHFITIALKEYYELIHESELLRCLKAHGIEDTDVWSVTMDSFYPDNINPDDWRVDR